jgi:hypothetical protein
LLHIKLADVTSTHFRRFSERKMTFDQINVLKKLMPSTDNE